MVVAGSVRIHRDCTIVVCDCLDGSICEIAEICGFHAQRNAGALASWKDAR